LLLCAVLLLLLLLLQVLIHWRTTGRCAAKVLRSSAVLSAVPCSVWCANPDIGFLCCVAAGAHPLEDHWALRRQAAALLAAIAA
jgi:hypothetical protein